MQTTAKVNEANAEVTILSGKAAVNVMPKSDRLTQVVYGRWSAGIQTWSFPKWGRSVLTLTLLRRSARQIAMA